MNHPGDDALRALSLGRLAEAELTRVSAHLSDCPACCLRIDQLAADDPLLERLRDGAATREAVLVGPTERRSAVRALRQLQDARTAPCGPYVPATVTAPTRIGDYDILAEVGRGGMGVVYQARHRTLHRPTAVKMVLAGEFASATEQLRFRLEAELAARVRHPNFVQVYEVGSHDGRPFLAMEWVAGGSLAARLTGAPWSPGEAASLVETLARATHVAHDEGVVHRDLKPANILLAADGTPKITDFGLAQPLEGGRTLTRSGVLVGTPGYMAPEQAAGTRALVGPATDVYSLGVVLYQLCTGRLPIQADGTLEWLRAVTADEPVRPRRLQPRLPRDLEAVTLRCLEKEPRHRYPSALALAEDLGRFREGKPVLARPAGAITRLTRACRRRPLVAALFALLALSLLAGMGGVTWKWLEANGQRDLAVAEKQAALYQAYRASLAAAGAAIESHDMADAARHLRSAPEDLRGWEWKHLSSRLDDSSAVFPVPPAEGGVLVAGADRLRVATRTGDGVRLTDLLGDAHTTVPVGPDRGPFTFTARQTRLGLRLTSWVEKTTVGLHDETGRVLSRFRPRTGGPGFVTVSPDGTRLAQRWLDGGRARLQILDADTGAVTRECAGHDTDICAITFSPDGARVATCGEDLVARVWDAVTGALLVTCRGHTKKVVSVAFSPDGSHLVTTSSDGTVRQWDSRTGRGTEPPYERHTSEVFAAAYSPDGQLVASSGFDRTVRVWRATGRQDVAVGHGHTGRVIDVAFAPDGRRLASLSCQSPWVTAGDNTVRLWDVDPAATLPVLRGHTSYVYPVSFSPDGRWLASGGWDGTARLWDAATGEPCATLPHPSTTAHPATVWNLAFGPDGTWLVTACPQDHRLRVWDTATGRVRREITVAPGSSIHNLALSPDGTRAAVMTHDPNHGRRLTVCDVPSGTPLFSGDTRPLSYSPDGRWLAGLEPDDKTVLLLDAKTHETTARLVGHENTVFKTAFSRDGRTLATCSGDQTVRLWNLDGEPSPGPVLRGHNDEILAVAFHPDGTRLATAGRDGGVWLWDLARGEVVARLPGHSSYVWSLAFSPDGATLASGSGDGTARLWDTAPLRTRFDARRASAALRPEAERLVDQFRRRTPDAAEIVSALRADRALSEPLRQEALRAVLRRAQQADAAPPTLPDR